MGRKGAAETSGLRGRQREADASVSLTACGSDDLSDDERARYGAEEAGIVGLAPVIAQQEVVALGNCDRLAVVARYPRD
jgi:hypothetical protein